MEIPCSPKTENFEKDNKINISKEEINEIEKILSKVKRLTNN